MSKKWLFALAAWYVAWSVVASVFSKKKWKDVKKELENVKDSKEDTFKVLLNNFVDTQKNLLDAIKEEVLTDENKALYKEKKAELIAVLEDYKVDWEKLIEQLKNEGWDIAKTWKKKIEKLYEEKKVKIDKLIWDAPEIAEDIKERLLLSYEDFKVKLKEK